MPYVPSEKTDPPAEDRNFLDPFIEKAAEESAKNITNNFSLLPEYKRVFENIAYVLKARVESPQESKVQNTPSLKLGKAIFEAGERWGYEGAFLGELNYAITRFIQRVPQIKVASGDWKESDELRYWLYACTGEPLACIQQKTRDWGMGISKVFGDIGDEYKWKVNRPYEAYQIVKSGDCYDTPYYTRLIEVVNEIGTHIGYIDIFLKRSPETLIDSKTGEGANILPMKLVLETMKRKAKKIRSFGKKGHRKIRIEKSRKKLVKKKR